MEEKQRKQYSVRFDAKNCTDKIVLSPSGLMAQPSVGEKQQLAVANLKLTEGQYYFEVLCPFSCENIKIGLVQEGFSLSNVDSNQYVV